MKTLHSHSEENVMRFQRTKTALVDALNLKVANPSLERLDSVYEGCNCEKGHQGNHHKSCCKFDSSFHSAALSSQLEVHRSPSANFEDYQNRRCAFLARQSQP